MDNRDNCIITLLSAALGLYDAGAEPPQPTLQTLNYGPAANPLGVFVNAALTVTGFSMSITGWQFDTTPATGYGGPLWLQFSLNEDGTSSAFIYTGSCTEGCTPNTDLPSVPALMRISVLQVPEPGSLALLLSSTEAVAA